MIRRAVLLILLPAVITMGKQAPDLTEARTAFTKADGALNEAWMAIKKTLPKEIFAELKVKQREWIESRDWRALESSPHPKDVVEAKRSPVYWQTAASQTNERAQWLRRRAKKEADPLTGLWSDGNGGHLEVVEQKEKLLFVFHTVRGRGYNVGVLAGVASWNKGVGRFSDKGREKNKTEETTISFTQRDGWLDVTGSNTSYYHGHHAYFDGAYYLIAPLDDKETAYVIKAGESGNPDE
jgi:uncharacterized protein YecT (DUF1311 family)